jgi:hypothetical protein
MYFYVIKLIRVVSLGKFDVLTKWFVRTQTMAKEITLCNDKIVGLMEVLKDRVLG